MNIGIRVGITAPHEYIGNGIIVDKEAWILENGTWSFIGIWYNTGIWNYKK